MAARSPAFARTAAPLWTAGALALAVWALVAADAYALRVLTLAGVYALMALGYQLIFGRAGALSLAQGAFFAVGAYAVAIGTVSAGLPFLVALGIGVVLAAALAAAAALPVLRLETHYFALATLGLAQIALAVAVNWESATGGANGIAGVAPPEIFGWRVAPGLPLAGTVWGVVAVTALASARLARGLPGVAYDTLRAHPLAAEASGIDTAAMRGLAFVAAAAAGGLAGGLHAATVGVVSPDVADFPVMVTCLAAVVIGGRRHVAGAVLGALLLAHLPEWFRFLDRAWLAAYAAAMLAVVVFAPDGIAGWIETVWRRVRGPGGAPAASGDPAASTPASRPRRRPSGEGLRAADLARAFGGVAAVDGVSLAVAPGEIVGLIGPNGSGKTTLANLVSGVERPDRGTVTLDGRRIDGRPPHVAARAGIARTFQNLELPGEATALDAVAVGAFHACHGGRATAWAATLLRRRDPALDAARAIAMSQLARLGLADVAAVTCGALPPGRRRLVEIARALSGAPGLLILDEPAAGLAENERAPLADTLRDLARDGIALLVIDHAMPFLLPLADRVVCLDRGRVLAEGPPGILRANPRVAAAYFGRAPAPEGGA